MTGAIAAGRRAVALGPNDAESHAQLGNILNWSGQPKEAIGLIEKARLHTQRRRLLGSNYVGSWHIADVQRLPGKGPLTGALPTFGVQCPLRADSERPCKPR